MFEYLIEHRKQVIICNSSYFKSTTMLFGVIQEFIGSKQLDIIIINNSNDSVVCTAL